MTDETPIAPKDLPGRFARDEDGAIMILTMIMAFVLVKVALSAFNVGFLTAERIRLQMVADTAAYSSSVWQARFLNYCAYTRRAVIANYANIGLITAMEANFETFDRYHAMEMKLANYSITRLYGPTMRPDGTSLLNLTRQLAGSRDGRDGDVILRGILHEFYEANMETLVRGEAREAAEHLSKLLAESQVVLYDHVREPWKTVLPELLEEANKPVNGRMPPQITVARGYEQWIEEFSDEQGFLNNSFFEKRSLADFEDDIICRFDRFTKPTVGITPEYEEPQIEGAEETDFPNQPLRNEYPLPERPQCNIEPPSEEASDSEWNSYWDRVDACHDLQRYWDWWDSYNENPTHGPDGEPIAFDPRDSRVKLPERTLIPTEDRAVWDGLAKLKDDWKQFEDETEEFSGGILSTLRSIWTAVTSVSTTLMQILRQPENSPLPFFISRPHWGFGVPALPKTGAYHQLYHIDIADKDYIDILPIVDVWPVNIIFDFINSFIVSGAELLDGLGAGITFDYKPTTMLIVTFVKEPMDLDLSSGSYVAQDGRSLGVQIQGFFTLRFNIKGVVVPLPLPLVAFVDDPSRHKEEATYWTIYGSEGKVGTDALSLYDLNHQLDLKHMEPSVYVALEIRREQFIGGEGQQARIFGPPVLPLTDYVGGITAISRAKVAFVPPHSPDTSDDLYYAEAAEKFFRPNLYYPYWEAQLAPVFGPGFGEQSASPDIERRGRALIDYVLGGIRDRGISASEFQALYGEGLYSNVAH